MSLIKRCMCILLFIVLADDPESFATGSDSFFFITTKEQQIIETDTVKVHNLIRRAQQAVRTNLSLTDSLSKEAYRLLQSTHDDEALVKCLILMAYVNSSSGKYQEGFVQCRQAINLSEKIDDKKLISQSYNQLYLLYYQNGEYDSASIAAERSLAVAREIEFTDMLARGYQNFGILNSVRGNHYAAIESFLKSEEYYTALRDDFALAMLSGNIGVTFEEAGNMSKAMEYLQKELALAKKIKSENLLAWTMVNIGAIHSQTGNPDSAIYYYNQSLEIAQRTDNNDLVITNLDNIGSYYSSQKDFRKATDYLMKAYALANTSGYTYQNVYTSGHLAENYWAEGKLDSARKYAQKQLELAIEYEFLYDQKLAYGVLSKIYASKKDYKNAYEAQVRHTLLGDTLFNTEKSNQIEELRERYEAEKKDRAIVALHEQQERAKFRRNTYAIIGLVVVAALLLLYFRQRSTSRRNLRLLEKEQQLEKMKSQFFANISHEFRTPLTLILGPIDMLNSGVSDPQLKAQISMLQRNANRLLVLINQLLDLAKLESGELRLHSSIGNLAMLLKGVTQSFSSLAEINSIRFTVGVQNDPLMMSFDQEKIETILTNVLSNAFRFTPPGGEIDVSLRIAESQTKNKNCVITIRDTGTGIPKEELERVFNRFYQSIKNNNGTSSGTGIGLALTRELVELHNGTVEITNNAKAGIAVTITLPIPDVELSSHSAATVQQQSIEKSEELPVAEGYTDLDASEAMTTAPVLLLMDDNIDVMQYLRSILSGNYQLLEAANGNDGVALAIEHTPDLIISDVMMPGKNGYEVCEILKNDARTSHIPIILLTAKADSDSRIEGFELRADDYITKPFIPRELNTRIHNLIESRKMLRERYKKNLGLKPADVVVNSVDEKFLSRLMLQLEEHLGEEHFSVTELSDHLAMSRSQLHRKLKALLDKSPNEVIRSFRLNRAHDLLRQRAATASEVAYTVGFSSPSYFSKCFHQQFGYSPSEVVNHA